MAIWDTNFEQRPLGTDSPAQGDDRIRELKAAIRERLEKEHTMDTAGGALVDHGWHKNGSTRVYVGTTAPENRPDGSTALTAGDNGRLWIHSTTRVVKVWDFSAGATTADRWVEISGALIATATSLATASALMQRDSSGRARVADPSNDADIANKGWVRDFIYPVGSYYTQYPNASSNTDSTEFPTAQRPATLFGGTWAEQWATESVYFRTRGTLSDSGRSSGKQSDQFESHTHTATTASSGSHTHDPSVTNLWGLRTNGAGPLQGLPGGSQRQEYAAGSMFNSAGAHTHTLTTAATGGSGETRVINRRIKVWKRTA
jgi:hypothetical protein